MSIKKLGNPTFSDICLSIIKEISKEIKKFEIFRCLLVNAERCNSPYWRSWPTPALAQDRHGAGEALQYDQFDDDDDGDDDDVHDVHDHHDEHNDLVVPDHLDDGQYPG